MIDRQTQEYGIIDINGNYVMRLLVALKKVKTVYTVAVCIQVYIGFRMKRAWDFLM